MFLTDITDQGWVGVAYVGVLCGVKHTRASISAYYSSDIYTAEVISFFRNNELSHFVWFYLQTITHEIGHNLNMEHDFKCKPSTPSPAECDRFCATNPSQTCTNIGSNMDYYEVNSMIIP